MSSNKSDSVLIIGSSDHTGASKCIKWGELAYVGDYDALIIDTTTLTQALLESIISEDNGYLDKLRKDIKDVQEKKGIKIVCVTSPYVFVNGSREGDPKDILINTVNNYSWSPVIPYFELIPKGEKLDLDSSALPKTYIDKMDGYTLLFKTSFNNTGYVDESKDKRIYTKLHSSSLLKNVVGRYVAFAIRWKLHQDSDYRVLYDSNFPILFVPPTKNVRDGIDILISEFCQIDEESAPEWIQEIEIPGEKEIKENIGTKAQEIQEANQTIQALDIQLQELIIYKKLLYTQGKELEEIVEKSFALLGVKLDKPEITNIEDRFFETSDKKKIYIEIRGANRLMNEGDLTQLFKRVAEKPTSTEYKTRGVFVFNHQNKSKVSDRAGAFHFNIEEKAKTFNLALIDTVSVFELVKRRLKGETTANLEKDLFNTIGVYKLPAEDM